MAKATLARLSIAVLTLSMFWCGDNQAYAQVGQGASATLTGRVTDSSGALIPGASLSLASAEGGLAQKSESNDVGYYTFSGLRPGSYKLTVSKAGFADVIIPMITLDVQQTASVDITLNPGKVAQQVTVSAAAVALQTQTGELSSIVSNRNEQQLPLVFRDPTQLVDLVAGVSADMRQGAGTGNYGYGNGISYQSRLDFSINGGTTETAIAMVDGVDITVDAGDFNSVPIIPTPDFTQEFKVLTNNYSAQFGRGAGVLNIVTKSGTNHLHGTAYEFLQNNVLNANDLFSNRAGQKIPHSERNQFGFAVGGPAWIPHVYDGRNKTFWFMDLERLDQTKFLPLHFQVPSMAQREGDFSDYYGTNGTPITIYNTSDTTVGPGGTILRVPFMNNQVPINNSFATNITKYWPLPNSPGVLAPNGGFTGISDYNIGASSPLNFDRFDIKVDHSINDANRLMWRYSKSLYHVTPVDYLTSPVATEWGYSTRNNIQTGHNMVLSDTWTVSPTLVLTNAINWSRFVDGNPKPNPFDLTQLGGPFASGAITDFVTAHDGGPTFPNINFTNSAYAGMGNSYGNVFTEPMSNYEYEFGIVKTHGKHTISAGFEVNMIQYGDEFLEGFGSALNFTGQFTNGPNPLNPTAYTGDSLADLETGLIGGGSIQEGFSSLLTSKYYGWYFQDDIKLTNKLTVNLGVRYDFTMPQTERFNNLYWFVPTLANPVGNFIGPNTNGGTVNQYLANLGAGPVTGSEQFINSPGSSGRAIVPTNWNNLAPRLGFAYSLRKNLVVRGGWAKLYTLGPQTAGTLPVGEGSFSAATNIVPSLDGIHPDITLGNPYPNGFNAASGSSQGLLTQDGLSGLTMNGNGSHTPFEYQWNLGVQTQLPGNATISIAYAGTRSHFLPCPFFACGNQVPYPLVQKYGSQLTQSIPNPYSGIITNPNALLSAPTVQMGQLLTQWGAFPGATIFLPPIDGPGINQDVFQNSYNALEVQYTKHFSGGLTLQVAYAWSKNLTNADTEGSGFLAPAAAYQNVNTFAGEWSRSAEDVPQRLVIGHVYDLPFGKGQPLGSSWPSAVDKVLGHWQFSGVSTIQSGYPLGINEAGHTTGAFGGGDRPNMISDPCMSGQSRSQLINNGGLNPAAFSIPAPFTFGNAPRTLACRGNNVRNFDWALIKFIPIKENYKIEFRSELFNAFNRPQLAEPNTTFNSSGFGTITSQINSPRVIQFGLKLTW